MALLHIPDNALLSANSSIPSISPSACDWAQLSSSCAPIDPTNPFADFVGESTNTFCQTVQHTDAGSALQTTPKPLIDKELQTTPQTPVSSSRQTIQHPFTRRNFFRFSGALAAGLILFKGAKWAFGYEIYEHSVGNCWAKEIPGCTWDGVAYTDRLVSWFSTYWWWQLSSNQWFMLRGSCDVSCVYTTELYQCMAIQTFMEWGDENNYHPDKSLWIPDGNDCRIRTYIDGELVNTHYFDMINPDGAGPEHTTGGWRCVNVVYHWFRRDIKDVFHRYHNDIGAYDFYDWGEYVGTASNPARNIVIPQDERPGQTCPKLIIQNDRSLRNSIVVIRPRALQKQCAAPSGASKNSEASLQAWDDEVCRLWLCIEGSSTEAFDTNCFIPLRNYSLALSHRDEQLPYVTVESHSDTWSYAQSSEAANKSSQNMWCVKRDGAYHLFCDCTGQALWYPSSNNNPTVKFHSNGYCDEEWSYEQHWWTIDEVQFSGSVSLSGAPTVGSALSLEGLYDCTPKESEGLSQSSVSYHIKLWSNTTPSTTSAHLVFEGNYPSTTKALDAFYTIATSDLDKYFIAQVNLFANCASASWNTTHTDWQFKGTVYSPWLGPITGAVSFYVDGEKTPCYVDTHPAQSAYVPPAEANAAAHKANCENIEAWFTDEACTKRFISGTSTPPRKLFGYNQASVYHRLCAQTQEFCAENTLYSDQACTHEITLNPQAYDTVVRYKSAYRFPSIPPAIAYYERDGEIRTLTRDESHIYLDDACTKALPYRVLITENTCAYYRWIPQRYDGIYAH